MTYDLIIIGAGPAGVSAALYATSRGLKTLVLEKYEKVGGTLKKVSNITHFAGFPTGDSGEELADLWNYQLRNSPVEILQEKVISSSLKGDIKIITCENNTFTAKSVIITAGTTQNIPNIEASSTILEKHLHNDAVSFKSDYKNAVVIGGSDGAAKEALYLSKALNHVDMIIQDETLKSVPEFTKPILNSKNITLHLHSKIVSAKGDNSIESITIKDTTSGKLTTIPQKDSAIFYYIGSTPNTKIFPEIEKENGYIKTNSKMLTNIDGVYAAGDIIVKEVRQISTSISDGAIAGIQASKYILKN